MIFGLVGGTSLILAQIAGAPGAANAATPAKPAVTNAHDEEVSVHSPTVATVDSSGHPEATSPAARAESSPQQPATPAPTAAPVSVLNEVIPFASLDSGAGLKSADGNFSFESHMKLQFRFEHVVADDKQSGFRMIMARPLIRGVAFRPWLKYFIQWELASASAALLDAEVTVQPIPEIGLKVGQFVTPFSREFLVPPGALLFPDFSPSNIRFRSNRDQGAMLMGSLFGKHIEYFVAAVNGNGINKPLNDDARLAWIGRIGANVVGENPYTEVPQLVTDKTGLAIGINGVYEKADQTVTTTDPTTGAVTTTKLGAANTNKLGADVSFHTGPLSVQTEVYTMNVGAVADRSRIRSFGGFAQVGVFIVPKKVELAARVDLLNNNVDKDDVTNKRLDAMLAYYVSGNHLKLQLRYARADNPVPAANTPKGTADIFTLQSQLWF